MNKKNIIVGMSGGIDSSMALVLLKEQGWSPIGVSLKYAVWESDDNQIHENICCSQESFAIAEHVCNKLDIPYEIINVADDFQKTVIDYFKEELQKNRTPNPCIICNRKLKFAKLFEYANSHDAQYVATGHYAKIQRNPTSTLFELVTPKDTKKNQTYMLSFLPQQWLSNIIFPLADYTKKEIYALAEKYHFEMFNKRKESQDICFIGNNSMNAFLEQEIRSNPGMIQNTAGETLGSHRGLHFYTIGQRKGINLSGGPYYVVKKDSETNMLIVSKNQEDLFSKKAILSDCSFQNHLQKEKPIPVTSKIRYLHKKAPAILTIHSKKTATLEFLKPQKAITKGQYAVCYAPNESSNSTCIGGGKIIDVQ